MAGVTGSAEVRDRRDGWTDRGVGLVLADGATWHLPAIDDGLLPYLPGLTKAVAVFHRLGDHHREAGIPAAQLIIVLGIYVLDALGAQYRTDRETLAELIPPVLALAVLAKSDEEMVLAGHLDDVWEYAHRRRLARFADPGVGCSLN